jgi:hypothetical protein
MMDKVLLIRTDGIAKAENLKRSVFMFEAADGYHPRDAIFRHSRRILPAMTIYWEGIINAEGAPTTAASVNADIAIIEIIKMAMKRYAVSTKWGRMFDWVGSHIPHLAIAAFIAFLIYRQVVG